MARSQSTLLTSLIPSLHWMKSYKASSFKQDGVAGITTAIMLIPQGMAYALLAGLDPIMGLYASTLPLIIYTLLGTSRQLSVGPMAMSSLLMASSIHMLSAGKTVNTDELLLFAFLITLTVGGIQLLLGIFRLGGLVNLLSYPVVTGFTAAAALVIASSQLQHLVQIKELGGKAPYEQVFYLLQHLSDIHMPTFILSIISILSLVLIKKYAPKLPSAIIVVIVSMILAHVFKFDQFHITLLEEIPSGLPSISIPSDIDMNDIIKILPGCIAIALVAFMESISSAKVYARQNGYTLSPSQELIALGGSNIASSVVQGCVVGGALSRTAVNADAGAKTPMANIITALIIAFTLAFMTAPFAFLATPVLAALIIVAVISLIDIEEFKHLLKVKHDDFIICCLTFLATLFLSVTTGILVGVLTSLLWLVFSTTRPDISVLGKLKDTNSYRSLSHFDDLDTYDRILIIRMDAQFFFGNVAYLKDTLYDYLHETPDATALVLDASSMNALDSTASDAFIGLIKDLRQQGIEVMISHVKGSVMEVMRKAGLIEVLGKGHMFYEVHDAVLAALRHREAVDEGVTLENEDFGDDDYID
jgi:sulfate permease, SulP family